MLLCRKDNWNFPTIMSGLVFIHHDCKETDVLTKCWLVTTETNYWCDVMWCDVMWWVGYISHMLLMWLCKGSLRDYTGDIPHTRGSLPLHIPLCHHSGKTSLSSLSSFWGQLKFIILINCCEGRPEVVVDNHRILGSSDTRSVPTLTLATVRVRPRHHYCYHHHHHHHLTVDTA